MEKKGKIGLYGIIDCAVNRNIDLFKKSIEQSSVISKILDQSFASVNADLININKAGMNVSESFISVDVSNLNKMKELKNEMQDSYDTGQTFLNYNGVDKIDELKAMYKTDENEIWDALILTYDISKDNATKHSIFSDAIIMKIQLIQKTISEIKDICNNRDFNHKNNDNLKNNDNITNINKNSNNNIIENYKNNNIENYNNNNIQNFNNNNNENANNNNTKNDYNNCNSVNNDPMKLVSSRKRRRLNDNSTFNHQTMEISNVSNSSGKYGEQDIDTSNLNNGETQDIKVFEGIQMVFNNPKLTINNIKQMLTYDDIKVSKDTIENIIDTNQEMFLKSKHGSYTCVTMK